ncbi:aminoacyl-tRNA hydrolase [Pseudorhodoferax sp.]|jgi:PTH1 family peptidyl-tRNA hydrolase|uniref:aminoacyl-tRNA hydrolase n=1 Tax=Pseudorhodoferax sp. TaxID=1993553 RepID=UPI001B45C89B|nr:aminoacyl-tRNA hydrolase [Pseudorhodoferax sp.]MBP8144203.1 aminoacyl-tRNA hydrolase [Inhella sp.]
MLKLLVGLGNPGAEYEDTRHNAGFAWIEAAARELRAPLRPEGGYFGVTGRSAQPGGTVWLLMPMTYMNLSGKSVSALARFFKIAPEEILVVHDELDLAPGEMKLKQGGGNGGHNGLKDIQAQLGSADFWRLRLGIGHPGHKDAVAGYVLRRAPAAEREALQDCIDKSLQALPLLLGGSMDRALQKIHAKPPRPKPPKPVKAAATEVVTADGNPSP